MNPILEYVVLSAQNFLLEVNGHGEYRPYAQIFGFLDSCDNLGQI